MAKKTAPDGLWERLLALATGRNVSIVSAVSGLALFAYYVGGWAWDARGIFEKVTRGQDELRVDVSSIKQTMTEMKTNDQAFVDCLLNERANPKTFKCALAPPLKRTAEVPVRRVVTKQIEQPSWWQWFAPAQAEAGRK